MHWFPVAIYFLWLWGNYENFEIQGLDGTFLRLSEYYIIVIIHVDYIKVINLYVYPVNTLSLKVACYFLSQVAMAGRISPILLPYITQCSYKFS